MKDRWYVCGEFITKEQLDMRAKMITYIYEYVKRHYGCCGGGSVMNRVYNMKYADLSKKYNRYKLIDGDLNE